MQSSALQVRSLPQKHTPAQPSSAVVPGSTLAGATPLAPPAAITAVRLHQRRNRRWLGAAAVLLLLAAAAYTLNGGAVGSQGMHRAPAAALASLKMTSYYEHWIRADLKRWQHTGITTAMVDAAASPLCDEHKLRFQILNGSLYIDHIHQRSLQGWYPAVMGRGWLSAKGRVPYGVLALMHVLRTYPGQVPDIDAVLQVSDHPCIPADPHSTEVAAKADALRLLGLCSDPRPPVFSYTHEDGHVDVPFPDFSYWGHEMDRFRGPGGADEGTNWVMGWDTQLANTLAASPRVPYRQRLPSATWRGRSGPGRDWLREKWVKCRGALEEAGRTGDAAIFNLFYPDVRLDLQHEYRYPVYIESEGWATNFKHKLASGSAVLAPAMLHREFFSRALLPNVHYVPLDPDALCEDTVSKVHKMNQAVDDHFGIAPSPAPAPNAGAPKASLEEGGDEPPPVTRPPRPSQRQTQGIVWAGTGGSLKPWEIGAAAQKFVTEHVRMADALEYLHDALRGYAALQIDRPAPSIGAACYTGARLLEEFSFPHPEDGADVARTYPWLAAWDGGCPDSEYAAPGPKT